MEADMLFLVYVYGYLSAAVLTAGILFGFRLHEKPSFWDEETMVFASLAWPVLIPVFAPFYIGREIGRFFLRD